MYIFITLALINSVLLYYIYNLEKNKCDCSKDWRRDYIKYYSIAFILVPFISYIFSRYFNVKKILTILSIIIILSTPINIWCLYTYSNKIKNSTCKCANTWQPKFMSFYSVICAILLIMSFIGVHYSGYALFVAPILQQ